MAVTHLLLAFSLVFVCLTFGVSANGTESYGDEYQKPKVEPNSNGYQPTLNIEKPKSFGYDEPKSNLEKPELPGYEEPKPNLEKPKTTPSYESSEPTPNLEKPKPSGYEPKPDLGKPKSPSYEPKPNLEKPKPSGYEPKPNLEKPKSSAYSPKPNIEKPRSPSYEPKPNLEKPKSPSYEPTPNIEKPKPSGYEPTPNLKIPKSEVYKKIGVQGIVYCQVGSKRIPLEGAVARVTCLATDEYGYETPPFSVLSGATDKKGYFFATFDLSKVLQSKWKLSECKTFLEASPLDSCNVPTDINKGITGCRPTSYHLLTHNKMKLFSVGPFVYSSKDAANDGGY